MDLIQVGVRQVSVRSRRTSLRRLECLLSRIDCNGEFLSRPSEFGRIRCNRAARALPNTDADVKLGKVEGLRQYPKYCRVLPKMLTTDTSTTLLMALERNTDGPAWERFCARYEPMILAFVRRSGLQEDDARDAAQETMMTFLTAFREGKYDRTKGRLRSWLQGIAFRKTREAHRRLARREVQLVDDYGSRSPLDQIPGDDKMQRWLDEAWEEAVVAECLKEVQKHVEETTFEAFRLYALEDWPAEKVAEKLGISKNVVYISKNRVLSRLR